ncbi:MAG: FAD-binding oxidoreductase, partial [Deltaproteobacteria bacterium]|nr:FAD-binding oxidoreductase [Deltaproteobacteria bacterium]
MPPPKNRILEDFCKRYPDLRVISDPEKLEYYRQDLNADLPPLIQDLLFKSRPDLVLQPATEEHILSVLSFAREENIPVTVRGAGTWGYGGAVPTRGGILIDLGLMNTIQVDPEARELPVGPGARFLAIDQALAKSHLTLLSMPSGKGGTLTGWISTGGMGFGTFHHGPVRNQIVSLKVITPDGKIREVKAANPEIDYFLSTEGQMGIIVEAKLRVGPRPAKWYPFILPFGKPAEAYSLVQELSTHPRIKPDDLIVYHSELVRLLKAQANGAMAIGDGNLVLVVFAGEEPAREFAAYLQQKGMPPGDTQTAQYLWNERFLPMAIKSLGPSLLAAEVVLPLDQAATYHEEISEWGKRLGMTFYPTAHLINSKQTLFLALITTDHRKAVFYADLLLVPMMTRLAIQHYRGKPYGLGIWNTPFLKDLYPKEES